MSTQTRTNSISAEKWTPAPHLIGSWLIGLSLFHWTIAGWLRFPPTVEDLPVRLTMVILNLCVGGLFLFRNAARREGSWWMAAVCLPTVLLPGLALSLAPSPGQWPHAAQGAFVVGGAWAITSLLQLGRSFAILPAVREIVASGPYRLLRHPAYAGESLMLLACSLAYPSWAAFMILIVAIPLVIGRILCEETLLAGEDDYRRYAQRVPWRLVPMVW